MTVPCPHCGHGLPADYKRIEPQRVEIRGYLLPALYQLALADRALRLDDLTPYCDRAKLSAHFAQLRYWHLIDKPDAAHYRVTEHGKNFCLGVSRVPEWVYTLNNCVVDAPDNAEAPRYLFIHEIEASGISAPPRQPREMYQPRLLLA